MSDYVAYLIVVAAFIHVLRLMKVHTYATQKLSAWLLARGNVKWAFRVRDLFVFKKSKLTKKTSCH